MVKLTGQEVEYLNWLTVTFFFKPVLMWFSSFLRKHHTLMWGSWLRKTRTDQFTNHNRTAHSNRVKLWYFPSAVTVWFHMSMSNSTHSDALGGFIIVGFCYTGGNINEVMKKRWTLLCVWNMSAVPIWATRVPQTARNSLWKLRQRQLTVESLWTLLYQAIKLPVWKKNTKILSLFQYAAIATKLYEDTGEM